MDNEQIMNKEWVTVTEAVALVDKSEMTIRRFVTEHKSNNNAIKKDRGKVYINLDLLSKHYPVHDDSQMLDSEQIKHQKDFAELTLQKQEKDIINKLIEGQNKPFTRLPVFWVTIGFVALISILGSLSYLLFDGYKKELLNNNISKMNDLKDKYSFQIKAQQSEIANQNARLKELKEQYSLMLGEMKTSYQNLNTTQEKQIAELSNKLNKLNTQYQKKE